jgi:hypothetical protein
LSSAYGIRGVPSYVNLVSGDRSIHILYGNATGGGHLWPGDLPPTSVPLAMRV